MTISLQYLADLNRVRISLSGYPDGEVMIERSINQLYWEIVRGGVALPIAPGGTAELDDYEWIDGIPNYWRARLTSTEDNMDVFAASGTWNKPAGLVAALVIAIGGGGAGGGAGATAAGQGAVGGGGGGGELKWAVIPASSLGATETVTIGAGGTGAAGAAGGNGGNTSYGPHVIANGGTGGSVSTPGAGPAFANGGTGGSGGAGTASQLAIPGNDGISGLVVGGNPTQIGYGAPSFFGGGRRHSSATTGANGLAGTAGAGGSGGFNFASQATQRTGGAGGSGRVVVIHFFDEVV